MKQHKILQLIRNYQSTGHIDDALIPFFDQDGQWRGDQIRWQVDALPPSLEGIRGAFLPAVRRTRATRAGRVLRTSYWKQGGRDAKVNYCGVEGSFIVSGDATIHAANLRDIGGHFIADTENRIYLPNLGSVGGRFEAMRSFTLIVPRLRHVGSNMAIAWHIPPMLETVGGRLGVYWSFAFRAPRLRHVGGCLVPHKCTELIVPQLETVGCGLLVTHAAAKIDAPKLRTVGGDFLAPLVADIRAPRLRVVSGNLDSGCARGFYDPVIRVGGEWTCAPGAMHDWLRREAAKAAIQGDDDHLYI